MPKLTRGVVLLSLMLAGGRQSAQAQTYTCLTDTAVQTQVLYNAVLSIVTGTDSQSAATRQAYQLPAVSSSKVSVVTTASVCRQAGGAYHTAVTPPGTPPVSRTLVVIKVGSSRYVVVDPNQRAGEFSEHEVFDAHWVLLGGFT